MSGRKIIALGAGLGAAALWAYLSIFDKDTKMLVNEINLERARRVHSHWDDHAEHILAHRQWKPYRLPFLDR